MTNTTAILASICITILILLTAWQSRELDKTKKALAGYVADDPIMYVNIDFIEEFGDELEFGNVREEIKKGNNFRYEPRGYVRVKVIEISRK
jgi:hypothetical protein